MASAGLRQKVDRILDALPESATPRDLIDALEGHEDAADAGLAADSGSDEARDALGIRNTCAARRRRAADRD